MANKKKTCMIVNVTGFQAITASEQSSDGDGGGRGGGGRVLCHHCTAPCLQGSASRASSGPQERINPTGLNPMVSPPGSFAFPVLNGHRKEQSGANPPTPQHPSNPSRLCPTGCPWVTWRQRRRAPRGLRHRFGTTPQPQAAEGRGVGLSPLWSRSWWFFSSFTARCAWLPRAPSASSPELLPVTGGMPGGCKPEGCGGSWTGGPWAAWERC